MKFNRVLAAAVFVPMLFISGCSAVDNGPQTDSEGKKCLAAGKNSDAIKFTGEIGKDFKITSKLPLKSKGLQRTVLKKGKGKVVQPGQRLYSAMSMINGKTGETIVNEPESPVEYQPDSLSDWAKKVLNCAVAEQQIIVSGSFKDFFPDGDPAQGGLKDFTADDTLVLALQIGKIEAGSAAAGAGAEPGTLKPDELLKKAEGKKATPPQGLPQVKLAADGAPTINIPRDVKPPRKLQIATLIAGKGEKVQPGDRVYVNYRGVIWRTGAEFDSSWQRGEPANFITTQVIPGFTKALEGQKVGSQVMAVVPANDGGYGSEQLQQMGNEADDVMVFVLDILGTVHAK